MQAPRDGAVAEEAGGEGDLEGEVALGVRDVEDVAGVGGAGCTIVRRVSWGVGKKGEGERTGREGEGRVGLPWCSSCFSTSSFERPNSAQ